MSSVSGDSTLAGRKVLITRASDDCEEWAARVSESGAIPVEFPCLVVEPVDEPGLASTLSRSLRGAAWIVATSRRGVDRAHALVGDALPASVQTAAVGPRTASRIRELWGRIDLVAETGTGQGLAVELARRLSSRADTETERQSEPRSSAREAGTEHVVLVTARAGRRDVESVLAERGIRVDRFELYETVSATCTTAPRRFTPEEVDVVLLASPSAVEGLMNRAVVPENAQIITIGPTTAEAARRAGLRVDAEARTRTLEGVLEEIR